MIKIRAMTPVSEPTKWVAQMVALRKKDGSIRICIDPRDLNKALRRPHHLMQSVEDVASRMPNATVFSTLDARSGFWKIKWDYQSLFPHNLQHTVWEIQIPPHAIWHYVCIKSFPACNGRAVSRVSLWYRSGWPVGMGRRNCGTWCKSQESPAESMWCQLELKSEEMQVPPWSSFPLLGICLQRMVWSLMKPRLKPQKKCHLLIVQRHYTDFLAWLTISTSSSAISVRRLRHYYGVILKGFRVVVPESLRKEFVQILHKGHLGADATRRREKDIVYWPSMMLEIDSVIASCHPHVIAMMASMCARHHGCRF